MKLHGLWRTDTKVVVAIRFLVPEGAGGSVFGVGEQGAASARHKITARGLNGDTGSVWSLEGLSRRLLRRKQIGAELRSSHLGTAHGTAVSKQVAGMCLSLSLSCRGVGRGGTGLFASSVWSGLDTEVAVHDTVHQRVGVLLALGSRGLVGRRRLEWRR